MYVSIYVSMFVSVSIYVSMYVSMCQCMCQCMKCVIGVTIERSELSWATLLLGTGAVWLVGETSPLCIDLIIDTEVWCSLTQLYYISIVKPTRCTLLSYSMVQSPSWEANWFAASQEIPRISRNPKVYYRTHKRPPTVSILGQPNPVHIPKSNLLEIRPNIHPSTPRSPQWFLPSGFPTKTLYTPTPHPYAPYAQPISFFSILSPAQYWVRSTNHLAPRYAVSSIPPLPRPS